MNKILRGVARFQRMVFQRHRHLFARLEKGQNPEACFVTCADSRINPNLITGTDPGDLFVVRNAGNIIPPFGSTSPGEFAAVEFAISLGVRDVIVCGHSHCGAMRALASWDPSTPGSPMNEWLQYARPSSLVRSDQLLATGDRHNDLAMNNVLRQLDNLRTWPGIAHREISGELRLHAWFYRFESGTVESYRSSEHCFVPLACPRPVSA